MEKLPPIPTPWPAQWREFRYQFLPVITFCGILAVVVYMWRNYVVPPNVLAQVEPITARVISPLPGMLVELDVERYQRVTNGQIIAVIETLTSNSVAAAVSVIAADLALDKARMQQDEVRNMQNYAREVMLYEEEKALLQINQVNVMKAQADFLRESNLWHATSPPATSEALYDMARYTYLSLATNVAVTEKRLADKAKLLPTLLGTNLSNLAQIVDHDVRAQMEELRASQHITLRSPVNGTISAISNHVGEGILAGRPIVIITAQESSNILAYARQPLNTPPKVGDRVMVRRQTFQREVGFATILQVGTQLEMVDPAVFPNTGTRVRMEMGLPFLVALPKNLTLTPGEKVDVMLSPRGKSVVE